ncbi:MAG: hypothetical protein AAFQ80_17485, partial [Cyanobacteria bacterium J06621_8]
LTAKKISKIFYNSNDDIGNILSSHVFEPRWREVVILVSELINNSDKLINYITKSITKKISSEYSKFIPIINWTNKKIDIVRKEWEDCGYEENHIRKNIFNTKMHYYIFFDHINHKNEYDFSNKIVDRTYSFTCEFEYKIILIYKIFKQNYLNNKGINTNLKFYTFKSIDQLEKTFSFNGNKILSEYLKERWFDNESYDDIFDYLKDILDDLLDSEFIVTSPQNLDKHINKISDLRRSIPDNDSTEELFSWWKENGDKAIEDIYEILQEFNLSFVFEFDEQTTTNFSETFSPIVNILYYIRNREFIY